MEYNRTSRRERLVTNYSLEDPTFVSHVFAFEKTILLILENGSNSLWLIEIDKKSGGELNRRKIVCTGAFQECMALDSQHVLIYMAPDQANAAVFQKYKEVTGCDCLCYLYNVKTNQKYFVKAPLIAKLGCAGIKKLTVHGDDYLVLLDPFAEESVKENYFREQRWINADIRDNIWLCRTEEFVSDIEAGLDTVTKRCIASADIKALVRYMGTEGDKVYFRAKEFRSGAEKICSYDVFVNALAVEASPDAPKAGTVYMAEEDPFKLFSVSTGKEKTFVKGIVNSEAELSYSNELGSFLTCCDNRYVVTSRTTAQEGGAEKTDYVIFDAGQEKSESYACSCFLKGSTLVLY